MIKSIISFYTDTKRAAMGEKSAPTYKAINPDPNEKPIGYIVYRNHKRFSVLEKLITRN